MENKMFISALVTLGALVLPGFAGAMEATYELPAPLWFLVFTTVFCGSFIVDKAIKAWRK